MPCRCLYPLVAAAPRWSLPVSSQRCVERYIHQRSQNVDACLFFLLIPLQLPLLELIRCQLLSWNARHLGRIAHCTHRFTKQKVQSWLLAVLRSLVISSTSHLIRLTAVHTQHCKQVPKMQNAMFCVRVRVTECFQQSTMGSSKAVIPNTGKLQRKLYPEAHLIAAILSYNSPSYST